MPQTSVPPPFDAYQGDEPFIFVSYCHADASAVFPDVERLHREGYRIWYDEGIDPGNEWPEALEHAIEKSAFFLVFMSDDAVESQNVRNEIHFARHKNKPFVAVHIEDCQLRYGLELTMSSVHAMYRYSMPDDERYWRTLLRALPEEVKGEPGPRPAPSPEPPPKSKPAPPKPEPRPFPISHEDTEQPLSSGSEDAGLLVAPNPVEREEKRYGLHPLWLLTLVGMGVFVALVVSGTLMIAPGEVIVLAVFGMAIGGAFVGMLIGASNGATKEGVLVGTLLGTAVAVLWTVAQDTTSFVQTFMTLPSEITPSGYCRAAAPRFGAAIALAVMTMTLVLGAFVGMLLGARIKAKVKSKAESKAGVLMAGELMGVLVVGAFVGVLLGRVSDNLAWCLVPAAMWALVAGAVSMLIWPAERHSEDHPNGE